MKPLFEVAGYIASGALRPVMAHQPPIPVQMACLYSHRRRQDPKTRLFIDFLIERTTSTLNRTKALL